jgi:hypothetical protein
MKLRFALSLWILLLAPIGIPAQTGPSNCYAHILVISRDWNNPERFQFNNLSTAQVKWWLNEGQKKFKGVCLALKVEDADYVLIWSQRWQTNKSEISMPVTTTSQQSGNVTVTSINGAGVTNTSGTYRGTTTTTTYENTPYEYTVQYVAATLHRTEEVGGRKQVAQIPVFISDHKGYWNHAKPDKDILVDSVKFIAQQKRK